MIIANIFTSILNSVLSSFASGFSQAASSFLAAVFQALNASTSIRLSGANFAKEFDAIFGLGLLIALLLALVELAAGALARDGKRVTRVPRNLIFMIVGTILSVGLVNTLLAIADELSVGLLHATGFVLSSTEMAAALTAIAAEPAAVLVMAGFMIMACISIYLALIARQVLILVAAVLAPLALSGMTSKWTAGWWRRWAEMMLGLIFSKVVLVIVLITGFHVIAGMGATNVVSAIGSLIGGVGLLMAGAFAPIFAMKMVHFTGGQFEGAGAMTRHFASSAVAPVQKAGKVAAAFGTGGVSAAAAAATGLSMGGLSKAGAASKEHAESPQGARPSAPPSSGAGPSESGGGPSGPRPSTPRAPTSGSDTGATVESPLEQESVLVAAAPVQHEATAVANAPEAEAPGSQRRVVPNEPTPEVPAEVSANASSSDAPAQSRVAKAIARQRASSALAGREFVAPPAMAPAPQGVGPSSVPARDNANAQLPASLAPSPVRAALPDSSDGATRGTPSSLRESASIPSSAALESGPVSTPTPSVPPHPAGDES